MACHRMKDVLLVHITQLHIHYISYSYISLYMFYQAMHGCKLLIILIIIVGAILLCFTWF